MSSPVLAYPFHPGVYPLGPRDRDEAYVLMASLVKGGVDRYSHAEGDHGWKICPNLAYAVEEGWLVEHDRPGAWNVTEKGRRAGEQWPALSKVRRSA